MVDGKSSYFDKEYYSRKSVFETMRKGGYIKSKPAIIKESKWKWNFVKSKINKSDGSVLDIGCGMGYFLDVLPDSFEKYGVDISDYAIRNAIKNKKLKLKVGDISKSIPFKTKFDLITAFDVLEHIQMLDKALNSINKSLGKEGYFVVQVPIKSIFHIILSKFNLGVLENDPTHCQKLYFNEWEKILSKYFKIEYSQKSIYNNYSFPGLWVTSIFVLKKS